MTGGAFVFMAIAWACVLGLMGWSWTRLLRSGGGDQHPPPPGTSL